MSRIISRFKREFFAAVALTLLFPLYALPVAGQEGKMKVAFVEFATPEATYWVRANVAGANYVKKNVKNVEVRIIQSVPEGPPAVPVFQQLGAEGFDVVFANGYGYQNVIKPVAAQYPKTVFINEQAAFQEGNLGSFYGRVEDGRYLTGIVAGLMTKSNIIGFVGNYAIPPVIKGVNAFARGVQSVNPKAVVRVNWINSWYDPPAEKEAADAHMNAGADVVATHADSGATIQAAAARGKYAMSSAPDHKHLSPKYYLTGTGWNWGPFFAKTVEEVRAGTWKAKYFDGTLANGTVILGEWGDSVPQSVKDKIEDTRQQIVAGKLDPLQGPIYDQSGKLRVPKGEMLKGKARAGIDWLVKGVEGGVK